MSAPTLGHGAPATPAPAAPPPGALRPAISEWRGDLLAVLFLAASALVLHREGLFGGPAFYESDTRLFYFPLADWVGEQLRTGVYPLWLPGIFTGYPIFADGELGLLYLPQVALLLLLPTPLAMVWLRVLHTVLAGAFMHLFLRTLRLGPLASLGGALVFAFGSFVTAQLQHENVIRSAIWLPLVLTLAERALRATGRRALGWAALAVLAFAQSALGLHVQPVLMLALTLGAYALFRALAGWPAALGVRRAPLWAPAARQGERRLARLRWPLGLPLGIILGGLAVAAAQWLPLAEWARASFRAGGVSYEFASAFALAPESLATLLFPYFFRLPDNATWWTLWQQWETELYAGIPTLALAVVGVLMSRRREVLFFLPLGLLALWVAMAAYAPVTNLHQLLWSLPGFSFLRAPGRFTYLVVFALAGLSALGLQALVDRRARLNRLMAGLLGALPALGLLAALLALWPAWRAWLLADPERGQRTLEATYLAVRAQYPIDPRLAYDGLVASLDLAAPKTAWSLALLALTAAGFAAWLKLGPRRAWLGQAIFVSLLAVDLLVFAADFHPKAPLASLRTPALAGVPPGARVILRREQSLASVEPNQLLVDDIRTVEGYSSLPSQRLVDLYAQTRQQPALLDLWSAPYVVEPTAPTDRREVGGVQFRLRYPLAAGFGGQQPATFRIPPDAGRIVAVRLVATLSYAFDVPQGTEVGELQLVDARGVGASTPLRAGVDVAERAIERPSIQPLLRHAKPPAGLTFGFEESSPLGEDYTARLYVAEWRLATPVAAAAQPDGLALRVRFASPTALLQVYGVGLVRDDGAVVSLSLADSAWARVVGRAPEYRVLANERALPRAYVRDRASAIYRATRPNATPVQIMASPGFDPATNVLIEGDQLPNDGTPPASVRPAQVEELGPNALRITATADRPSYLVVSDLYHRGWKAWVDGQPAPVSIANAAFRAVPLEPGTHVVEMRFEPLSTVVGAAISLLALAATLGTTAWGLLRPAAKGQPAGPDA